MIVPAAVWLLASILEGSTTGPRKTPWSWFLPWRSIWSLLAPSMATCSGLLAP